MFDGAAWSVVRDWAVSNTFAWTPAISNPSYLVGVWVRSNGVATDTPEAFASASFAIQQPRVTAVTVAADRIAPQPPGTTITWTATATGGAAPLQYKWYVFNGVTWSIVRDWAVGNTFAWTPATPNAAYLVGVWVRSNGVAVDVPEAYNSTPFAIQQPAITATRP